MIIKDLTDNDLYKFTTQNAIQKLYPDSIVRYEYINRGNTKFPDGFDLKLRREIDEMALLTLTKESEEFIRHKCYYLDHDFIDYLKSYRFDPGEVNISLTKGNLKVNIEGYWYRTVLWEVPILAAISEIYNNTAGNRPADVEKNAKDKAIKFKDLQAEYSDFGTRRRFSFDVHDKVIKVLKKYSGEYLKGTSNVFLAMKHDLTPIGTHPHEWFMYHATKYGYSKANNQALEAWIEVYHGNLGIALTDTYTTDIFFGSFSTRHAGLFDGVRWDSGDPLQFTEKAINYYKSLNIDPKTKTIVYSDALNVEKVREIKKHVNNRIHDVYGIGTYLTNDAGVAPLNNVIKMTHAKNRETEEYKPAIKLSDSKEKFTGDTREIEICKDILNI
ncbi:MAG: nicotinate phosphoribosyltransferase [Bacteroidales bacterium]|nr:MAG: nicotinate phosphoribosyltransferase [Bacteroidales bacterium]